MMKNKAGWVALIVLAIASLLMIFFVMPNINAGKDAGKGVVTAEKPVQDESKPADGEPADSKPADVTADAKGARPTAQDDAASQAAAQKAMPPAATDATPESAADTKSADTKSADPAASWTVPGFDVLRVEPDGSTVIAGRAQPNTRLEIVNGDTVIASADVGQTGDFAAILDKPLPAGDYQLTLRSVGENGASKSSEEVATVSIPKDKAGELLAMVSKPGEASRILATPSDTVKPVDVAKRADTAAATTAPATTAPPVASGTSGATITPPTVPTTDDQVAVGVSAVEIEGRKIFVAGNAKPNALVRIYADDVLVGEMKADAQGRFVVDGTIDLSVGNHMIRADMMSADGSRVALRAAVPFERPAGDQVAAVAQANAQGSVVSFDGGSFDGLRLEATKALGLLKGLFANGKTPTAEQLAAARSATEIALGSLADFKVADNLDQNVKGMVAKTATAAADALAMLKALPQDAASISASLGKIEAAVGSAVMPRTDGTGRDAIAAETVMPPVDGNIASNTPAQSDVTKPMPETATKPTTPSATTGAAATPGTAAEADNAAATSPSAGQTSSEPQTVQQAPLTQSKTSVIIRRGDTLWQISRRVYGAGVRYTTIYLANEDQISDPNRILPGQVFGVPDKAMGEVESEAIHRKHLK